MEPTRRAFMFGAAAIAALPVAGATALLEMPAATALVSPGRQLFHPHAAKAWARFSYGDNRIDSYNVAAINRSGVGDYEMVFARPLTLPSVHAQTIGDKIIIANIGAVDHKRAAIFFREALSGAPIEPDAIAIIALAESFTK